MAEHAVMIVGGGPTGLRRSMKEWRPRRDDCLAVATRYSECASYMDHSVRAETFTLANVDRADVEMLKTRIRQSQASLQGWGSCCWHSVFV